MSIGFQVDRSTADRQRLQVIVTQVAELTIECPTPFAVRLDWIGSICQRITVILDSDRVSRPNDSLTFFVHASECQRASPAAADATRTLSYVIGP